MMFLIRLQLRTAVNRFNALRLRSGSGNDAFKQAAAALCREAI